MNFWETSQRWTQYRTLGVVIGISALCAVLVPLALTFATTAGVDRPPYVVVEAKTELLRYRVVRASIAKIPLRNARVNVALPKCDVSAEDVSGVLEPAQHSLVTYRSRKDSYSIEVQSLPLISSDNTRSPPDVKSYLVLPGEVRCELPPTSRFTVSVGETNNTIRGRVDLPIAGPAELGAELSPVTIDKDGPRPMIGLLREAKVRVFGRAGFGSSSPALYTVADSEMTVPVGARLSAGNVETAAGRLPPPWYGLASFEKDVLTVSASTVSAELLLFIPGVAGDAERLGLRTITRVLNDPALALLLVGFATFGFVFQTVAGFVQLADRR